MGYKTGEKALTKMQVEKLLASIPNLEELVLIKIAISGGLRRSDIVNILKKDVNLVQDTITFYEHKKKRTKTIDIPTSVMIDVKRWFNTCKYIGSDYLFPARLKTAKHISSRTAYNILQRNLKLAGIPSKPFHALRATCIKLCQRAGWSPEQVSKLTGDTIRVIQEHYLTPSTEEMKQVTEEKSII